MLGKLKENYQAVGFFASTVLTQISFVEAERSPEMKTAITSTNWLLNAAISTGQTVENYRSSNEARAIIETQVAKLDPDFQDNTIHAKRAFWHWQYSSSILVDLLVGLCAAAYFRIWENIQGNDSNTEQASWLDQLDITIACLGLLMHAVNQLILHPYQAKLSAIDEKNAHLYELLGLVSDKVDEVDSANREVLLTRVPEMMQQITSGNTPASMTETEHRLFNYLQGMKAREGNDNSSWIELVSIVETYITEHGYDESLLEATEQTRLLRA